MLDWIRNIFGRRATETSRFSPVSENDAVLLPEQIQSLKLQLSFIRTDIVVLQEPRIDRMLPECAMFMPHTSAEFSENPNLAMLHGMGLANAWIHVPKLRKALSEGDDINDYRSLFRSFVKRGYDVKKVIYIRFESSLKK